jgi:hypothetical protein
VTAVCGASVQNTSLTSPGGSVLPTVAPTSSTVSVRPEPSARRIGASGRIDSSRRSAYRRTVARSAPSRCQVPTSRIRPSAPIRLTIDQSASAGTTTSATRCRTASSPRPEVSSSAVTAPTSAITASRAVASWARSCAARRSVMSRK